MTAYYNEIDPYAAQWLRNLIAAGHIAYGDVDERSIVDVRPDDLRSYAQCHFFAGIGGWSVALRLARWPDDRPVWTGSCPCQPFSSAGAGKAADDSRHLWPAWFPLISECRPPTVFGEQVEAAIGWGWLDVVFADLEGEGYACGAAVLPACSVGAPHIRQRLWFVADTDRSGRGGAEIYVSEREPRQAVPDLTGASRDGAIPMDHTIGNGRRAVWDDNRCDDGFEFDAASGDAGELGDAERPRLQEQRGLGSLPPSESGTDAREASERASASVGGMADTGHQSARRPARSAEAAGGRPLSDATGRSFWSDCDWLPCTDGKARPVEPGSFPLAHGVQRRASKLRAYGNAIVPQVAAEFIEAIIQCTAPSQ